MKKIFSLVVMVLVFATAIFAQEQQPQQVQQQPQVLEIRVQQQPQAQVGKPVPSQMVQNVSELVKTSQDLGAAIGGGLKNLAQETKDMTFGKDKTLVQGIDELSHTDAGKFTMAVIAWKVAGKDALDLLKRFTGLAVGIPLEITFFALYIWYIRKFLLLRTIKIKETINTEAKTKVIEYGVVNGGDYNSNDKRTVLSSLDYAERMGALFISTVVFSILSAINIGCVIF